MIASHCSIWILADGSQRQLRNTPAECTIVVVLVLIETLFVRYCRFTVSQLLPRMLLPWQHIDSCYGSRDLCWNCFSEVER